MLNFLKIPLVFKSLPSSLKHSLVASFVVLNFIGIVSCQKFLHDEPEKPKVLQVEMENKKCLGKITQVFSDYFQQKFNKADWDETWSCMDGSIVEFMNSTRGEKDNLYQASELKRFFKKLFKFVFKKDISDELVDEILKLKQSLIGGDSDNITRVELEKLRAFFCLVAKQMEALNPHLGVLLFRDELNVNLPADKEKVEAAISALRESVLTIIKNSNFSQSTYSLPEIKLLMEEVEKFAGSTDSDNAFSKWRKKLPFLEKMRSIFIGSTIEIKDSHEVEKIWMLLVDAFRSAVYLAKGINKVEFSNPNDFKILDEWVENNFVILLDTFQWKKKQEIQYEDLDYLIDELSKEEFWPKKLRADTFKITYRRFITRVLDDRRDDSLTALSYEHIVQMRREYRSYQLIQKLLLENIFSVEKQLAPIAVQEKLSKLNIKSNIQILSRYTLGEEKLYSKAWEKFLKLVNSKAYVRHWNADGQLVLDIADSNLKWEYRDLWTMNIYRWAVQALIRGFAQDPKRIISQEYMTKDELKELYTEFQLFCEELGIFDSRNFETYARSQKEADLFTPSGNGDNLIQFEEMVDLFTMMYSGGLVATKKIYKIAQDENKLLADEDVFGNKYISFTGFENILHNHFGEIFSNLPNFNRYVQALSKKDWQMFYDGIVKVSRICPKDPIGIETADQRTLTTVMNYIEDLFNLYDLNRNGTFDMQETEVAYGRFANFIVDVTKKKVQEASSTLYDTIEFAGQWQNVGLNVFKFMIFNGRAPSGGEILAFMWDDFWDNHNYQEADRSQIVKVFATLKAEIASNPPKCSK